MLVEKTAAVAFGASDSAITVTRAAWVSVFIFSEPAAGFAIYDSVSGHRGGMNLFGIAAAADVALYFSHVLGQEAARSKHATQLPDTRARTKMSRLRAIVA